MEKIKMFFRITWVHKILKILKWAFLILLGLFIILVIGRWIYLDNQAKTDEQVIKIHNTKLTLDDVMGKNLPPDPGALADATVQGIDANQNGIRDDVELAVFKEYPNSAKTRAVLLQYALALQMQMTLPLVNTETVVATVENKSRANICMWNLEDIEKYKNFVEKLYINTQQRDEYLNSFYQKLGSYTASNEGCDLDLSTLSN